MEAIGDITASAEVSRVEVDGEQFDSRIQGGILVRTHHSISYIMYSASNKLLSHQSDGLGGFFSALFTVTPLSIFAQVGSPSPPSRSCCFIADVTTQNQNNGVIAITRCANRQAGRFCCMFLILFGVLGKISGVFLASKRPFVHPLILHTHSVRLQFQIQYSEVSQHFCSHPSQYPVSEYSTTRSSHVEIVSYSLPRCRSASATCSCQASSHICSMA